jgi:oligopeptide transport system ATP-binding protein
MYLGRIVERPPRRSSSSTPAPVHPGLLSAIPIPSPKAERARKRLPLVGEVPSPLDPPSGCHFHTRCPEVMDRCRNEAPLLLERGPGHFVACHLMDETTG